MPLNTLHNTRPVSRMLPPGERACEWVAKWIWSASATGANQYICARRVIFMEEGYEAAVLHISADLRYRLYVNSELVGYGPPLDAGGHITYDSYDIRSLLRPGANVLAVEVFTGIRPRGGLICQVELSGAGKNEKIVTDRHWRVLRSSAWWHKSLPFASKQSGWYSEIFDSRKAPHGWLASDYGDASWENALVVEPGDIGPDGGGLHASQRLLEASELPPLEVKEQLPTAIVETGEVTEIEGKRGSRCHVSVGAPIGDVGHKMGQEFVRPLEQTEIRDAEELLLDQGRSCLVDNHEVTTLAAYHQYWQKHQTCPVVRHATITLDFGELVNGRIVLDVTGNPGAVIDVGWIPALFDGRVNPGMHANASHANRYTLRGGRERFESFNWMHFRYIRITFRDLDEPLQIHRVSVQKLIYPFERIGKFECSDLFLEKIWAASVKTMEVSTVDNYYLDMYREVRIYADYPQSGLLAVLATFGNPEVNRRFVRLLARHQDKDGLFLGLLEEGKAAYSYEQCLHVAILMACVLLYWNDSGQWNTLYPILIGFVRRNERFLNREGLLENAQLGGIGSFLDWGGGHARKGAVCLPQNYLYYAMLTDAARVARGRGLSEDAAYLEGLARPIPDYIFRHFWDNQRGVYVTNIVAGQQDPAEQISEHANYTALLMGLGKDGRKERILAAMADGNADVARVEPMFTLFPMQALFAVGESALALDFMRDRYSRPFLNGFDTMPEEWSPFASFREGNRLIARFRGIAYTSATVPAFVLSSEVLGVKPITPGFAAFQIDPQWGDLTWARGVAPSPLGPISVSWKKETARYLLEVTIPSGCTAHVHLPEACAYLVNGVAVETACMTGQLVVRDRHGGGKVVELRAAGSYQFIARD